MLTYRFVQEQLESGSFARRPKVEILLKGKAAEMKFLALLDSGAGRTIIPKSVADFLGIDYAASDKTHFLGFGKEPFEAQEGQLEVIFIGRAKRERESIGRIPVLVMLTDGEQEPVLGCEGVFDQLKITFIEGRKIQITRAKRANW